MLCLIWVRCQHSLSLSPPHDVCWLLDIRFESEGEGLDERLDRKERREDNVEQVKDLDHRGAVPGALGKVGREEGTYRGVL